MHQTINLHQFREAFRTMDRSNFSYEGLAVLFDYLEQYEDDTGEPVELDVIALCCDYSEDTLSSIAENYSIDLTDCEDQESRMETIIQYLSENTMVVGMVNDETIIYQVF